MADRASIFLLEDEALIRLMIAEIVEGLGHRVVAEAGTIDDGIRLAETAEFDPALLDINIDGDTSAEIAEIIERRGLPFLFVTGYRSTDLARRFTTVECFKTVPNGNASERYRRVASPAERQRECLGSEP
jgi:CheY-like chemotaxis protein